MFRKDKDGFYVLIFTFDSLSPKIDQRKNKKIYQEQNFLFYRSKNSYESRVSHLDKTKTPEIEAIFQLWNASNRSNSEALMSKLPIQNLPTTR